MDLYEMSNSNLESLAYFVKGNGKVEADNFSLLGFKENKAVVVPVTDLKVPGQVNILKNFPTKLSLTNFQLDESGEKYINLNGQKLKVVPQGKIPEEVRKRTMLLKHQMINIGSLKNPLKVRVISSATQINGAESLKVNPQDKGPLVITHDKTNNIQGIKKMKLISTKVIKPTSTDEVIHTTSSSHKSLSVIPKVVPANFAQFDTSPDSIDLYTVPLNIGRKPREKLLSKKNLNILKQVKMQALNLSKKKIDKMTSEVNTSTDIAVQTDIVEITQQKSFSDQIVQTDIQRNCQENLNIADLLGDIDLFSFVNSDSLIFNDVNFGQGPSIGKTVNFDSSGGISQTSFDVPVKNMGLNIGGKNLNDEKRMKQLLFFTDLRECLTPDISGNLKIHEGVIKNDTALVQRMCVALKARRVGVNLENHNGCTPLQLAIINNAYVDIVTILLDAGADITEADGEGNNILHLAAKFERHKLLEIILDHPVMKQNANCINSFNFEGLTPLMICCMSSWTEGAILFTQYGANVNLRDQTSGRTALFHAAEAMNVDIVRLLLECKADPKIKNFFGTSPHDAMYELDEMPDRIKNLIFGKTKKRTIEAEMNPARTAKAAKSLKTFSKLQKIERLDAVMPVPGRTYKIAREIK